MTKRFIEDEDNDMIDGILQPGGHLRIPMYMRDGITPNPDLTPVQRAIAAAAATKDAVTFDSASHKPGHRFASTTDNAKRDALYDAADRELSDAWKTKAPPPTGSYPEGTGHEGDNSRRDAQQIKDSAYAEYDLRIQNSWRNQS